MDWLREQWASTSGAHLFTGLLLVLVSFVLSFAAVTIVFVKIPANFFRSDYERHFLSKTHPVFRWIAIVSKNLLGMCLILAGLLLSLPGIPGPGILTIFIGLMLTDIPGKRTLEIKMIQRPAVLAAVNRLRARYNKESLQLDK